MLRKRADDCGGGLHGRRGEIHVQLLRGFNAGKCGIDCQTLAQGKIPEKVGSQIRNKAEQVTGDDVEHRADWAELPRFGKVEERIEAAAAEA